MTDVWHEDDAFWEAFDRFMFTAERIAAAGAEIEQILALTGASPGLRVLDTCCGPGRHSLELSRRGHAVTGVDRTERYLDRARGSAESEELELELVHSDIRAFSRPSSFDLAINLYTSFGYFEDPAHDRQVLENIYASLAPGGSLVIDLMGKEVLARVFEPRTWRSLDDGSLMLAERSVSPGWNWLDNRWIVVRDGETMEFSMGHRLYSGAELSSLLQAVGFSRTRLYGDFAGAPYDHEAKRLVVVATKE